MKNFMVYKFVVCKFLVTLELYPPSTGPSLHPIHALSSKLSPPSFEISFRVLRPPLLFPPLIWEPQIKTLHPPSPTAPKAFENDSQRFVS